MELFHLGPEAVPFDLADPAFWAEWSDDLVVAGLIVLFLLLNYLVAGAVKRRRSRDLAAQMDLLLHQLAESLESMGARAARATWRDRSPIFMVEVDFPQGFTRITCRRGISYDALLDAIVNSWRSGLAGEEPFEDIEEEAEAPIEDVPVNRAWWQVLGVRKDADYREVRVAYRDLAKTHHPDAGGDVARMADVNAAMDEARAKLKGQTS